MDLPDPKIGCHRTGFTKKCRKLVVGGCCNRWIQVTGTNPTSGEYMSRYDCQDNWQTTFLLELGRQQRSTASAVESFRNEMVVLNHVTNAMLIDASPDPTRVIAKAEKVINGKD